MAAVAVAAASSTVLSPPLPLPSAPSSSWISSWGSRNGKLGSSFNSLCSGSRSIGRKSTRGVVVFLSPPSNSQSVKGLDKEETDGSSPTFLTPEDVNYLWKLLAGSVGGGFVIKYGSVLFPDITTPNLSLALTIIVAPVIVSVLLLFKESSSKDQI